MSVLSIDPGLWKTGCALWSGDGQRLRAWTQRQGKSQKKGPALWRRMALSICEETPSVLAIEIMQVDKRSKGKERDLFSLSGVIGAVVMRFPDAKIVAYTPAQWKGSVPKHVMQARLEKRLTPEELKAICAKSTHDTWDAVGIGAKYWADQGHARWKPQR